MKTQIYLFREEILFRSYISYNARYRKNGLLLIYIIYKRFMIFTNHLEGEKLT